MLRRAKSFFIRKTKPDQTEIKESIPADSLSETAHLARRPISVDVKNRVIKSSGTLVSSDLNSIEQGWRGDSERGLPKRSMSPRRRPPKPKTVENANICRMSFPPMKNDARQCSWYQKLGMTSFTGSKKSLEN
ncbi:hypothetical protein WA026_011170 [Henosepilachna vigintioctopunctata]|uniref:Uncharacterized protein n=1 Tax=Henosepilachna vigintioctopunctata TaxID=420089 RepID=A0AAW1U537_9CUCU